MFVFFEESSGRVTHTINAEMLPAHLQSAAHIEVADGTVLGELGSWQVIDGALVLVDLGPMRTKAVQILNQIAGQARSGLVTAIPGQEMIYLAKETEARAYVIDPAPQMGDYPLLSAEVGITAPDAWSLAQLWLNMSTLWRQAAAALENARAGAIQAVGAAASQQEIDGIVDAFRNAMEAISV